MPRVNLVSREEWRAERPLSWDPIQLPISRISFTVNTGTPTCESTEDCAKLVRHIQHRHMCEEHLPDISYNFLVGGDGSVYEGRGWYVKPSKKASDKDDDHTIDIAYIGQYTADKSYYPWKLYEVACDLVLDAQDKKLITPEVDLIWPYKEKMEAALIARQDGFSL